MIGFCTAMAAGPGASVPQDIHFFRAQRTFVASFVSVAMDDAEWNPHSGRYFTVNREQDEWGEASTMVLQLSSEDGRPVRVPCWQYLYVEVCVRHTWLHTGSQHSVVDDGWWLYCSYTVDSWAAVRPTFLRYFHEDGLYHRASFFR